MTPLPPTPINPIASASGQLKSEDKNRDADPDSLVLLQGLKLNFDLQVTVFFLDILNFFLLWNPISLTI